MTVEKTISSREVTHGSWAKGAQVSQELKRVLDTKSSSRPDFVNEALDRICMKLSRIVVGDPTEPDHWHDLAGYATLTENELT